MAFVSLDSSVFSGVWSSFGPELVIFAVTIAFALAFQGVSRHLKPKKALGGKIHCPTYEPAVRDFRAAPPSSTPTGNTSVAPNVRQRVQPRRVPAQTGVTQARDKTLAVEVEAIFAMTRGTPSQTKASQALQLYVDLRLKLGLRSEPSLATAPMDVQATFFSELRGNTALGLFTALVQSAVRAGQSHLVERLVADMIALDVHRPVSFYETTMKQLAGQKQHRLALAMYDRLTTDGLEPSVVTYSCLIHFAVDVGESDRALQFFEKLRLRSTPSIRAYMTVLKIYAQRSDWSSALATFRDMQNRRVAVDNLAFNIVLSVGITADKVTEAEALLIEREEKGEAKPDLVGYNTVVKGYARRSDVESARRVMARASDNGLAPNAITFNTILDALVRSHTKSTAVLDVLDQMRKAGHGPDKFTCSILVRAVVRYPTTRTLSAALKILVEASAELDERSMSQHYNALLEAADSISEDLVAIRCKTLMCERGIAIVPTSKSGASDQGWRTGGGSAPVRAQRLGRATGL